ncbi:serine threonine protein kinase [Pochonia chlamydosporia 170]|uniref:Serine threonine protein kinase n=1 Tax=Pochonia chlamydosporia 170 TaxID=1380566 RepID=A0A179EX19_METCM|nr:serine threonine protein kinase [Pochonia chlamydosporia 170]OAQ57692.2 serine threonine protein kinase [Pochonia chlamydosporia 170]
MDEIEELRRLLREEQRLREEERRRREEERKQEQRRFEEEQFRREEEQRRREEEQRRREEEQRRREEEQRRREEEQRRREEAERLAKASLPLTLQQYLEACHSLDLAVDVVTDRSLTTQGDTTNPTGRIFPRRIIPWENFPAKQQKIWEKLSISPEFASQTVFPSQHQLSYVKSILQPISSEIGLRNFERDVVENAVQKMVDETYKDPILRNGLGLKGTVTFESHTNLGEHSDSTLQSMERMSISGSDSRALASASTTRTRGQKPRRKAKGKGNRADQFCIYRTSEGKNVPTIAIEYKAPHKLSVDEIVTGLDSEIRPERDVINKDGQGFTFNARALTAAVVTQLFSYMIGKGIRYGYFCTGQAFGFLNIPDDPSTVYCAVCVPKLDVMDDDENRLHRTAAAQVFAFLVQALLATPPAESWHDDAEKLGRWDVEYEDILSKIPPSERKDKEPRASPYKPQRWKGFTRSPIRTRSSCQPPVTRPARSEDQDDYDPPSPTPNLSGMGKKQVQSAKTDSSGGGESGQRTQRQSRQQQQRQRGETQPHIEDRLYCTHRCLLGLAHGGPLDEDCPNVHYHGRVHIPQAKFLRLIRAQLARDRGPDADCISLYLSGSRGALFKVRLSSYGYTFVAKGMESFDHKFLAHESQVYCRLHPIQGKYVPVCLGIVELIRPYHYDGGVYTSFLFLSWAGQSLTRCINPANKLSLVNGVTTALKELHRLGVLHCDAEPRNMLFDPKLGSIMLVDFERSEFRDRHPLASVSSNTEGRKRKHGVNRKQSEDDWAKELRSAANLVLWRPTAHDIHLR